MEKGKNPKSQAEADAEMLAARIRAAEEEWKWKEPARILLTRTEALRITETLRAAARTWTERRAATGQGRGDRREAPIHYSQEMRIVEGGMHRSESPSEPVCGRAGERGWATLSEDEATCLLCLKWIEKNRGKKDSKETVVVK